MEQFSLEKWLQDKSRKVVTRDEREVEILKTNRKDSVHPIIFTVLDQNNIEQVHLCNVNGICTTLPRPNKFDLFFADEENTELTEFEKEVAEAYEWAKSTEREDFVNEFAPKLLDLARKEIEKENPYSEKQDEQQPADKVEPKWKKGNDGEVLYETSVVWIHNETKTLATAGLLLDSNTFYLPISELEKLPKEEFEKQGEQKPADKPNIGIGDWIINNDKRLAVPTQILKIEEYGYVTSRGYTSFDKVKTDYRLWTIEDAKKGDILQANDCTLIFDSLAKDMDVNTLISSWYYCDTHAFYGIDASQPDLWVTEGIVPATEEQCDLLFQKMKEAGYEWDVEKKELKEDLRKAMEE